MTRHHSDVDPSRPRTTSRAAAQLLVVDVQERLVPHIHQHERLTAQMRRAVMALRALDVPILVSEQYVRGLGSTVADLAEELGDAPRIEKTAFSAWRDDGLRAAMTTHARPDVLICGIETHVCVAQTVLDLLDAGHRPFVLVDAVGSRRPFDHETALGRLRRAGAILTTVEAIIFELVELSGTEAFKRILPLVREL